jgi:hypothetical protein
VGEPLDDPRFKTISAVLKNGADAIKIYLAPPFQFVHNRMMNNMRAMITAVVALRSI